MSEDPGDTQRGASVGRLVVCFERRGRVDLGAVREEQDRKLVVIDSEGQVRRLPQRRVLHRLKNARVPGGDPRQIKGQLRQLRAQFQEGQQPLDLELLWGSLDDERDYSLQELAELYYGSGADEAVLRLAGGISTSVGRWGDALRLFPGGFQRVDAETHHRLRERRLREAAEREAEEAFLAWYGPWRELPAPKDEPPAGVVGERMDDLRGYALEGERWTRASLARRLARLLDCGSPDELLEELESTGGLPDHINELPLRHGIPREFASRVRRALEDLPQRALGGGPGVLDLREVPTVAVDAPDTREVDDALSAWEEDGRLQVAVHIAHVSGLVPKGGPLDREARRRGTSVYFPDETIPMLPWEAGERHLSLEEGLDRPAVSLIFQVEDDGHPSGFRFVESVVRVDHCVSYQEEGPPLARGVLEQLLPLAKALREARQERGAVIFDLAQVKMRLDQDGRPYPVRFEQSSSSHLVVSELMVLYNAQMAETLGVASRAALFKTQPKQVAPPPEDQERPLAFLLLRRVMPPTVNALQPGPHATLGLSGYVQGTSPIRRFGDLLAQRQLVSVLRAEPSSYTEEEVDRIRGQMEALERRARSLEEERQRYWICRWLENQPQGWVGLVCRVDERRILAYIDELGREFPCRFESDPPEVGTRVALVIDRCHARQRQLVFTPAK